MTTTHPYVLAAFQRWVQYRRKQRRRTITVCTLNELPLALQRDIGWHSARSEPR